MNPSTLPGEVIQAKQAAVEVLLNNRRGPHRGLPRTAAWGYPEPYTRDIMIAALGFACLATTPVLLAVMIENAGANASTATGLFMMLNFAARALIFLAVGAMGDALGLKAAYIWCAVLGLLALPFVYLVPKRQ